MTDSHQHALATLRDIDASFDRLFEAVTKDDDGGSTPAANPVATRHRAQAQIAALLKWIRSTWTTSDPPTLVFNGTPTTEHGVRVAVGDELWYRDGHQWYSVTENARTEDLQEQGHQPPNRSQKPLS